MADPFADARDFEIEDAIRKLANRCAEQGLRLTVVHIEATRPDMQLNTGHGYVRVLFTPKNPGDLFLRAIDIDRRGRALAADIAALKAEFDKPEKDAPIR